ncbi:DUF1127 domain-containing protein [Limimaricola litoreus]|uniref:DUF1127 domain-containing protein n=1 Tax=Limimaricola litoreus TaxID=2955316 RepID=UPI003518FF66
MSIYITREMIDTSIRKSKTQMNGSIFTVLFRWVRKQLQRRRMIFDLQAMDDKMLDDIGIHRADIPRLVGSLGDRDLRMQSMGPTYRT